MAESVTECKDSSPAPDIPDSDNPYFWYVNGHDCETFNLNRALGAVPFGKPPFNTMVLGAGFASTLLMICRFY